jgi:hypothetical protein
MCLVDIALRTLFTLSVSIDESIEKRLENRTHVWSVIDAYSGELLAVYASSGKSLLNVRWFLSTCEGKLHIVINRSPSILMDINPLCIE